MKGAADMFELDGKVAVVTGATGLLGTEFCFGLAASGAHVVALDLNVDLINDLVDRIKLKGGSATGHVCDVSVEEQVCDTVANVIDDLGWIDVLLNNAATKGADVQKFFDPFEHYDLEVWREVMAVNLDGMFLMAREVGRHMAERAGGSIIQTASIYGVVGPDQRIYDGALVNGSPINTPAVYSASKAAVIGLTRHLATYWADRNVRVNTLTPGGVGASQNETFVAKYSNRVPMRRMGQPNDLVGAVVFLASNESAYVTGQNIIVDGGLTSW